MKNFLKYVVILICIISNFSVVGASWFGNSTTEPYICQGAECGIDKGVTAVKDTLNDIETEKSLSVVVIDTTLNLLKYLTLLGVLIVIYAGFNILISGGDEEKVKTSRKIILYTIIGFLLIWFAWGIMDLIVRIFNTPAAT